MTPFTGGPGIERLLLEVFVIFAAAKVIGQVFEQARQPAIVGELLAGVLVGPAVLGWIHLGEFQEALAELGVIVLLFVVGLETKFSDLRAVGPTSMLVALLGVAFPFAFGWIAMVATGHRGAESLFVGTALVATSVAITARVLRELGRLGTPVGRVILGAAVIDDILALVLLAVVSGAAAGTISAAKVAAVVATAIAFVGFLAVIGTRMMRRYPAWLEAAFPTRHPLAVALMICLGLSALAAQVGLAAIVGAFMAGTVLAEARERYELDRQMQPVITLLAPFFFVVTGAKVRMEAFGDAGLIGLTALLTVLAFAGKLLGGVLGARSLDRRDSLAVGLGMVPRGEVGIIVASLGLADGTVGPRIYSVVVAVSLLTTVLGPAALVRLFRRDTLAET